MQIHVDRQDELHRFDELINNATYMPRVLFVSGDEGIGKSALLRAVFEHHRGDTAIAWTDLGVKYDSVEFLDTLADQFQAQGIDMNDYFRLSRALGEPQPIYVTVSNNRMKNAPLDISFQATEERRAKAQRLLGQLLDDLEAKPGPPRRLILLDSYEEVCQDLANWLQASFVERIAYRQTTVCAVAGKQHPMMPTSGSSERIAHCNLRPLEITHVLEWLNESEVGGTEHDAAFLHKGTKGIPGQIAIFIANLRDSQGLDSD